MEQLLRLIEADCTLTHKQLAAMTGTSVEKVDAEIRRLEQEGVIAGYKAVVDWDKTEREAVTALIEVKVEPQLGDGFDRVAERIYQYEEVESCYLMSGAFDMTVVISGRTLREVANFVSQKLATIDAVQSTATHFILKKYKENHLIFQREKEQEEGFCFV
jgi:DNA-binding Lrp family transcriptional regulator